MTRSLLAPTLASLAALLLAGCGGAAAESAESKVASASADLSTPESALAAVDTAERAIDRVLSPAVRATIAQSAGQTVAPAPPPPPPPPAVSVAPGAGAAAADQPALAPPSSGVSKKAPSAPFAEGAAPQQEAGGGEMCTTACSALASMERAAEHVCGMMGAGDAHCTNARDRVKSASARVRAACPACAG